MHRPDCHTAHNYSTINIMEAPDYLNVVDYDIQHYMTCHYMFLTWNPQGKRKRGRPKRFLEARPHSRHRGSVVQLERAREDDPGSETLEEEVGRSWGELERIAQDRRRWRRK